MRTFWYSLLVIVICGTVWYYEEHPEAFKKVVSDLTQGGIDSQMAGSDSGMATNAASAPPAPKEPEIITPDSHTYLDPSHVRPVEQPVQPGQSGTNAVSPAAGQTNQAP